MNEQTPEQILCEVFDATADDLQLAITLSPQLELIKEAMEAYRAAAQPVAPEQAPEQYDFEPINTNELSKGYRLLPDNGGIMAKWYKRQLATYHELGVEGMANHEAAVNLISHVFRITKEYYTTPPPQQAHELAETIKQALNNLCSQLNAHNAINGNHEKTHSDYQTVCEAVQAIARLVALASPQVKGYSVDEVRDEINNAWEACLVREFENEHGFPPPGSDGPSLTQKEYVAARLASLSAKGEAAKEDAVQRTACDYRNLECSNTGEMAGGKWVCSNHKARIQDPRKGKGTVFAAPEGTVSAPVEEREGQPFEKYSALSAAIEYGANNWHINTGWTELLQEINATITMLEAAAPSGVVEALRKNTFVGTQIVHNENGKRVTLLELIAALSAAPKEGEQSAPWVAEKIKDILNRHIIAQDGALVFGRLTATDELTRLFAAPKPNPEPLVAADTLTTLFNELAVNYSIEVPHDVRERLISEYATLTQWEASQPSPDSTPKN